MGGRFTDNKSLEDASKVNEMRKVRMDRWDNTRGRSEGPASLRKREITFHSLSGVIWWGGVL